MPGIIDNIIRSLVKGDTKVKDTIAEHVEKANLYTALSNEVPAFATNLSVGNILSRDIPLNVGILSDRGVLRQYNTQLTPTDIFTRAFSYDILSLSNYLSTHSEERRILEGTNLSIKYLNEQSALYSNDPQQSVYEKTLFEQKNGKTNLQILQQNVLSEITQAEKARDFRTANELRKISVSLGNLEFIHNQAQQQHSAIASKTVLESAAKYEEYKFIDSFGEFSPTVKGQLKDGYSKIEDARKAVLNGEPLTLNGEPLTIGYFNNFVHNLNIDFNTYYDSYNLLDQNTHNLIGQVAKNNNISAELKNKAISMLVVLGNNRVNDNGIISYENPVAEFYNKNSYGYKHLEAFVNSLPYIDSGNIADAAGKIIAGPENLNLADAARLIADFQRLAPDVPVVDVTSPNVNKAVKVLQYLNTEIEGITIPSANFPDVTITLHIDDPELKNLAKKYITEKIGRGENLTEANIKNILVSIARISANPQRTEIFVPNQTQQGAVAAAVRSIAEQLTDENPLKARLQNMTVTVGAEPSVIPAQTQPVTTPESPADRINRQLTEAYNYISSSDEYRNYNGSIEDAHKGEISTAVEFIVQNLRDNNGSLNQSELAAVIDMTTQTGVEGLYYTVNHILNSENDLGNIENALREISTQLANEIANKYPESELGMNLRAGQSAGAKVTIAPEQAVLPPVVVELPVEQAAFDADVAEEREATRRGGRRPRTFEKQLSDTQNFFNNSPAFSDNENARFFIIDNGDGRVTIQIRENSRILKTTSAAYDGEGQQKRVYEVIDKANRAYPDRVIFPEPRINSGTVRIPVTIPIASDRQVQQYADFVAQNRLQNQTLVERLGNFSNALNKRSPEIVSSPEASFHVEYNNQNGKNELKIEVFLAEGQTSRAINVPIQNSNMAPVLSVETAINGILLAAEVNNDASGFTAENDNLNNNEIKKAKRILNDHNAFGYSIARNETVSGHDYTITTYHEDGRVARTAKIHNVNQPQDLVFMALELHETTSRRYGEIQRVTPEFISSQAPKPAQITQAVSAANDMRDYYAAFEQNQRAIEAAQREEHPRRGRPPRTHNLRIADQYVSVVGGTSVEPNHSNTIADNNITNSTNPNAGDPATSVDPTVLSPNTQPTTGAPLADPAIATPANPAITISGNPTTGSGIADPFQLTPLSDPIPIRVKAVPKMNNNVMAMGFTPDYDDDFDNPPPDESKPTPEEIIIPDEENEVRPPNMEELPPVDSPAQDVPPGSPDQEHGNRNPDTDVSTRQVNNPEPSVPPSTRPAPAVTPPAPSEPDYDNEPDPLNTQAENDEPGSSSEPGEQADDADSLPPAADDEIVVDENNTDPVTVDGNDGQETGSPENTRGFDTALPTDGQELRIPDTLNGLWLPTPDEMNGPQLDWRTIAANDPDIQRFAQTLDDLIRLVGPEETDKLLVETLNDINHEQNPPGNSDEPSPSNPDADPDDIQDLDDVFKNISEDDKSFPDWLQSLINKGELTPEEAQQILDTMVPPENVVLDTTNNGQEIKLNEPDISSYIELLNLQTPEEIERFKRETLPIIQERLETPLEPENPGSVVIDPTPGQGDPDGADNEPEVIPEDGSNVADGEPDRSTPIDAEEFDAITRKMELEIFRILGGGTTIEESTTPSIEETSGRATINPDIINPTPPENPVRGPGGSGDVPPNNPPTDNVHISQAVGGRSSSASSGLVGTVMGVQGTIAQLEKLELNKGAAKLGGVKQLYYSQASLGLNVTATGAGVVTLVDDISALRNSLKATTPLTQLSTSGALRYLGPASIVISGVAAGFDAQAAEEANDGYAQAGAYAGFAGGTLAGLGTGYLGEAVIGGMALLGAAPPVLIGAGIIWGGYTIYNTVLGSQIAADYAQETIGKDWQKEYDQKAKQQAAEIQKDVDRIVAEYKSSVDSVKAYMKAHDDLLSACNGNNIQNIKKAQKQYEAAYKKLGEANGLDSADIEYLSGLNDNLLLAQYREKTRTVPVNHTDAERRRQENLGDINKSIVQIRNLTDESNKLNEAHFSDEAKGAREKEHKNLIAGAEQRIGIIRASQKQKKFADAISEIYSGNKGKPDAPGIVNSQDNIALEETARKELTEKYEQGKLSRADITKFKEEADKNREAQIKDMENLLAAEEKLKKLKEQQQKEKDPYSKQYAEDSIKAIDKVLAQIEVYKNTIVNENKLTDATFAKMNEYVTLNEVLNSQPTLNNDAKEKVSLAINDAKTVIDRDIINVEEFKDINKTIKANQDLLQQDSKTLTDFVTRIEELEKSLTQPENQQKAGTVRTEVKTHQGGVDQANTITDEEMNRMREELFSRVLMFDNDVTVMLDKQGRVSSYTDANGEWNLFFDPKDRPQLGDRLGNITSAVSQDMDNTPLVLVMKDEKGNTIITNLGEPYQADKQGDKDYFKLSDATKAFKKAEIALGEKYEDNSLDNSGNNNQNRDVREFLSRNAKEINFAISGLNAQLSAAQADGVNDKEKGDLNKQIEDINNRLKLNLKLNFNKDNQYEIISQPQLPKIVNPLEEVKGRN